MTIIVLKFIAVVVAGYILGSIPFGVLISKRESGKDVRQYGSGKMGMTNVLRTSGTRAAVAVGVLDFFKGGLAVILARWLIGEDYLIVGANLTLGVLAAQALGALASIAGHIYPVFVKFRGGRGVMTFFGGLGAMSPLVALIGGGVFCLGTFLSRYASLGSLIAAVSAYLVLVPLTILNKFPLEYLIYALSGVVIIFIMHRDNIRRLKAGKERRLGEKSGRITV